MASAKVIEEVKIPTKYVSVPMANGEEVDIEFSERLIEAVGLFCESLATHTSATYRPEVVSINHADLVRIVKDKDSETVFDVEKELTIAIDTKNRVKGYTNVGLRGYIVIVHFSYTIGDDETVNKMHLEVGGDYSAEDGWRTFKVDNIPW